MTPPPDPRPVTGETLLALIADLAAELRPGGAARHLDLDSDLEAEGGIDSLARIELGLRIERHFGHSLPERVLIEARTPRELLAAMAIEAPPPQPIPAAPDAPLGGGFDPAVEAQTWIEVLDWHARRSPDRVYLTLYEEGDRLQGITFGELLAEAEQVAQGLRQHDLAPGQPVGIMLPTGRTFFAAFYGTWLAGGVPATLYPPQRLDRIEEHLRRQAGILANAQAPILIAPEQARAFTPLLKSLLPDLRAILDVPALTGAGRLRGRIARGPADLAFLQYTSGSTGEPKGVMLSHANLLANVRAMGQAAAVGPGDVFVSWLPLYHDMGLIGACLASLYFGFPLVLMSPLDFIARPQRWLRAIHRHGGTLSAAPNFAYELCASRLRDTDLAGLDLRSWRLAFNGAEPVSAATLERFAARFAPYGLGATTLTPVYGLAENAVGLAFPPLGRGPRVDRIRRDDLALNNRAVPVEVDDHDAAPLVSGGRALPDHAVRVVDETGRELPDRQIGRIQFSGPSATAGYYRNPAATAALLRGEWRDTGDFGYLADAEIFITGRAKDLIIRAGRNLYPYELEQAVGDIPGIRKGNVAVFAHPDPAGGAERLVVLAETRETDPGRRTELIGAIERVTTEVLETPADEVVLVPPRTILKTSSGKIRRAACRALYESGAIAARPSVARQIANLTRTALAPALARGRRWLGTYGYGAYVWTLAGLLVPIAWAVIAVLPGFGRRRAFAGAFVRLMLHLYRLPVRVEGRENLPASGAYILAANHGSYLDGMVLTGVLPGPYHYVAAARFRNYAFTRILLGRLGTEWVDRFDPGKAVAGTRSLIERLEAGVPLLLFPEGGFDRAAGLKPFKMGTFITAAEADVPVVPVAIAGARDILRGEDRIPRHGAITVTVYPPIRPAGRGWAAAVALRDAVRERVLEGCGEPSLVR